MRRWFFLVLFLSVPLGLAQGPDSGKIAGVAKEPIRELPGTLVIHGGGAVPAGVRDRFIALAGGAKGRLVVIPTASAMADKAGEHSLQPWQKANLASLTLLHTRDRKKADDAAFVKP